MGLWQWGQSILDPLCCYHRAPCPVSAIAWVRRERRATRSALVPALICPPLRTSTGRRSLFPPGVVTSRARLISTPRVPIARGVNGSPPVAPPHLGCPVPNARRSRTGCGPRLKRRRGWRLDPQRLLRGWSFRRSPGGLQAFRAVKYVQIHAQLLCGLALTQRLRLVDVRLR
jgi:hypothetical protein